MSRKNRAVADRQMSLRTAPPDANLTLFGAREMYMRAGGNEFSCTITGYCRTQVFEFPGISYHPNADQTHYSIYTSPSIDASVTENLVAYFAHFTRSDHYAISPSLRHMVSETDRTIRSQQKSQVPVFVVIEESYQLKPVEMVNGECNIWEEMMYKDGEMVPRLKGGREGRQFISAWETTDGAWPQLPNSQQMANMVLAGVRVGQRTSGPIRKYLDSDCLVTDDGKFVVMHGLESSATLTIATPMDTTALRDRAAEIADGIAAMQQDISTPHIALLINSLYSDGHKDDAYERLHYLRLWQSLDETSSKFLGYQGNIRNDSVVLAGKHSLEELTKYRHDVAHWWTDTIDHEALSDIQRTINKLLRDRYF